MSAENLVEARKPTQFSSQNQPAFSPRNSGPISKYLRELGEATGLEMTLRITKPDREGNSKTSTATHRLETTEGQTIHQMIAVRLLQQALNGDTQAAKIVLDRLEGRVPQQLNLGNSDGTPLDLRDMSQLTTEQLRAIANGSTEE